MARSKKHAAPSRLLQSGVRLEEMVPEGYKMSAVFLRFMEPNITDDMGLDEMRQRYSIGVIAWNISFLPPHEQLRALMPTLRKLPVENQLFLKGLLAKLIERRQCEFADYQRFITDFELVDERDKYRLYVLSSPRAGKKETGET